MIATLNIVAALRHGFGPNQEAICAAVVSGGDAFERGRLLPAA
jgi:hypothetical protein